MCLQVGSACTGTGSFEMAAHAAISAIGKTLKAEGHDGTSCETMFCVEKEPRKQKWLGSSVWFLDSYRAMPCLSCAWAVGLPIEVILDNTPGFADTCLHSDIVEFADGSELDPNCVRHETRCPLKCSEKSTKDGGLFGFGAGFSRKSWSKLNNSWKHNKQALDNPSKQDPQSVAT